MNKSELDKFKTVKNMGESLKKFFWTQKEMAKIGDCHIEMFKLELLNAKKKLLKMTCDCCLITKFDTKRSRITIEMREIEEQ